MLKPREQWKLVGRPLPRIDLPAKVDGTARFGIDVRLPGLVYAVVRHAPALGGSPGRVDVEPAMKLAGVERVVRLGPYAGSTAALAVVGRSSWHARRGAAALVVDWQPPPAGTLDSNTIAASLDAAARAAAASDEGLAFYSRGEANQALAGAARRVEALYRAPYLAHATMEPINCTARVADGRVELWAPTQVPSFARAIAARVAGVPQANVTLHVTYLGGGFGRRLEVDFIGQAVRVALETGGRPVQLLWPREEDITHDFYRPAGAALMQGGLDAQGRVQALKITSAGDAITPRFMERNAPSLAGPLDLPDKTTSEGLFDLPYDVPHQRIAHVATHSGVPVGNWRSVGHSHNAFFSESFVDELAHAAGRDPVAFRLAMLEGMPRHAAVLKLVAEKSGWGTPLPAGTARGVALHESFGSIVAQVVEVSLVDGKPHRAPCRLCRRRGHRGQPRHRRAADGERRRVRPVGGAVRPRWTSSPASCSRRNFPNYPILTMAQTPRIETHLVASTRAPGGVGEPGTPPVAPAVANALFVLTGRRLRELPLL